MQHRRSSPLTPLLWCRCTSSTTRATPTASSRIHWCSCHPARASWPRAAPASPALTCAFSPLPTPAPLRRRCDNVSFCFLAFSVLPLRPRCACVRRAAQPAAPRHALSATAAVHSAPARSRLHVSLSSATARAQGVALTTVQCSNEELANHRAPRGCRCGGWRTCWCSRSSARAPSRAS